MHGLALDHDDGMDVEFECVTYRGLRHIRAIQSDSSFLRQQRQRVDGLARIHLVVSSHIPGKVDNA